MNIAEMVDERLVSFGFEAQNRDEVFEGLGKMMYEAGKVTDLEEYVKGLYEREAEFPTGVGNGIAIPHCKSDAILQSGVCYLRLEEPVEFGRMDDDEETVMTRSIFNLAITAGDHLEFLQKMMSIVGDEEFVAELEQADIKDVPEMLEKRLAAAEE